MISMVLQGTASYGASRHCQGPSSTPAARSQATPRLSGYGHYATPSQPQACLNIVIIKLQVHWARDSKDKSASRPVTDSQVLLINITLKVSSESDSDTEPRFTAGVNRRVMLLIRPGTGTVRVLGGSMAPAAAAGPSRPIHSPALAAAALAP